MSRRKTSQRSAALIIIGTALLLCVLAVFAAMVVLLQPEEPAGQAPLRNPADATLVIAYSPEKAALIQELAAKFNAEKQRTPDRQLMQVRLVELTPEEMLNRVLAGEPEFQALTPDSSLWLDQLNRRWLQTQAVTPGAIAPRLTGEPVRYAISPIVIAAWEDVARGLGWPDRPVGWKTLQTRAQQDGNFRWSHPSTAYASGLLATLAEFYVGAGVQRGLTAELAQDPKTIEFVSAIEKTVKFYGEAELAVIRRVAQEGPKSLDAFIVSEQLVVAFNTGVFGRPPSRLVAIYPIEGTLWADHPLALLETAEVTANQRRTFQALREFLTRSESQTLILRAGYRPADLSISLSGPASPLTAANGVDPAQPQTTLQLPPPDVVQVVQNVWTLTKRKTNVMLVVDTSGSMAGEKLANAKAALRTFLAQIPGDQERVGLVEFNSGVVNIIELDTLAVNRALLSETVDGLQANGNTALLDAVRVAYGRLQRQADPERINAIVAMTDGKENASTVSLRQLTAEIRAGNRNLPVIIFCIAYGWDADYQVLQALADASGGQVREGTTETIRELYKILSSYF
ncbi:MAG: VWA domain-containing protein [Anaerolineae bacterium]